MTFNLCAKNTNDYTRVITEKFYFDLVAGSVYIDGVCVCVCVTVTIE